LAAKPGAGFATVLAGLATSLGNPAIGTLLPRCLCTTGSASKSALHDGRLLAGLASIALINWTASFE